MRKQINVLIGFILIASLCIAPGIAGLLGCEPKPEDKCSSNLDCKEEESCVKVGEIKDCKARGDIGADCKDTDPPCLTRNSDNKQLVCDPADFKCKQTCSTNLDCEDVKTQQCNTTTGVCIPKELAG